MSSKGNENAKILWIQTSGTFGHEILDLKKCTESLDKRPDKYKIGSEKGFFTSSLNKKPNMYQIGSEKSIFQNPKLCIVLYPKP